MLGLSWLVAGPPSSNIGSQSHHLTSSLSWSFVLLHHRADCVLSVFGIVGRPFRLGLIDRFCLVVLIDSPVHLLVLLALLILLVPLLFPSLSLLCFLSLLSPFVSHCPSLSPPFSSLLIPPFTDPLPLHSPRLVSTTEPGIVSLSGAVLTGTHQPLFSPLLSFLSFLSYY